MNKKVVSFILIFSLVVLLLTSFASAGWFSDWFGKITGKAVANGMECSSSSECSSNYCNQNTGAGIGICGVAPVVAPLANGMECSSSSECSSNYCNQNTGAGIGICEITEFEKANSLNNCESCAKFGYYWCSDSGDEYENTCLNEGFKGDCQSGKLITNVNQCKLALEGNINLNIHIESIKNKTVTINGVIYSEVGEITKIKWDWGDGISDEQWFPAKHNYEIKDNYDFSVTAYDNKGTVKIINSKIRLLPIENITIHGEHVSFINFPKNYFDGSPETPERVIEILDIFYDILNGAHHESLSPERINFYYLSPNENGGAYSDSRLKSIFITAGLKHVEYHPWSSYAHEMSHNFAGQNPLFLFIAENGYSAFLDEHQAQINQEYVYRFIEQNYQTLKISENELSDMERSNWENRNIIKNEYNKYIQYDGPFLIKVTNQDQIENATRTGMALSYSIFGLLGNYGIEGIKIFNRAIKDDSLSQAGFSKTHIPTEIEMANYIVTAHSLAFKTDLTEVFKRDLNFPIKLNYYPNEEIDNENEEIDNENEEIDNEYIIIEYLNRGFEYFKSFFIN